MTGNRLIAVLCTSIILAGCATASRSAASAAGQRSGPVLEIPLDNSGIASWGFLNPRSPKVVPDDSQQRVRFRNETVDRTFVVTIELDKAKLLRGRTPRDQQSTEPEKDRETLVLEQIEQEYGGAVDLSATDGTVTATLVIEPTLYRDIDVGLLSTAPGVVVPFVVDFFDQTDDPAYSRGYFALRAVSPQDVNAQPPNRFTTNLVAGIVGRAEPCFGDPGTCKPAAVSPVQPYSGETKKFTAATGQLDFSQTIGNRADAKAVLAYESNGFGAGDEDAKVTQYQINVFGTNQLILTYGRFAFARPSNRIALNENGEGFRLAYKSSVLSYLVKRESDDGIADDHDRDNESWLFQTRTRFARSRFFRRAELHALWGEDDCTPGDPLNRTGLGDCPVSQGKATGFPHDYWTAGGEIFFTVPFAGSSAVEAGAPSPLSGSFAAYRSARDSHQADTPDGRGTVALLKVGRPFRFEDDPTNSFKVKPVNVANVLVGYGTGDEAGTARDEGYVGESAAFSQDLIFLSTLAPAASTVIDGIADGQIGRGLTNKWYYGLQYTDNRTSIFDVIVRLLDIDQRDVVSQSSTFSAHVYRFQEAVFGRTDAGWELGVDFQMEQPKSVKWQLQVGYFNPGDAITPLIEDEILMVTLGVALEPAKLTF